MVKWRDNTAILGSKQLTKPNEDCNRVLLDYIIFCVSDIDMSNVLESIETVEEKYNSESENLYSTL